MSLALLAAALLAPAVPAETPRAFLARIYAPYERGQPNVFAHPERLFAPPLVRAMREDSRLSNGEVGVLDYDPLCQCQEAGGIRPKVRELLVSGPSAVAFVTISWPGGTDRRDLILRLARTAAGWRIADVSTKEEPSLLATLVRENAARSRTRR